MLNNRLIFIQNVNKLIIVFICFSLCACSNTTKRSSVSKPKAQTVVKKEKYSEIINRVFTENLSDYMDCYKKQVNTTGHKKFKAELNIMFIIKSSGIITKPQVKGKKRLPKRFKRCLFIALKNLKFPKPPEGAAVDVNQPINFYPQN
jgi:hypothetical protein